MKIEPVQVGPLGCAHEQGFPMGIHSVCLWKCHIHLHSLRNICISLEFHSPKHNFALSTALIHRACLTLGEKGQ